MNQELELLQPTSILSLFDATKSELNSFVDGVMNAVQEGQADAVKVLCHLKKMEAVIGTFTDKNEKTNKRADVAKLFSSYVLDGAKQYPGKSFEAFGAKFEEKEVGSKWDYSQCNDTELAELETKSKEASDALKERQKYLQNLPAAGIETLDKSTGDMVMIYKPSKSSTTALTVSLK